MNDWILIYNNGVAIKIEEKVNEGTVSTASTFIGTRQECLNKIIELNLNTENIDLQE